MKPEEILEAAKELGVEVNNHEGIDYLVVFPTQLERFAAIIEKRTIERCAEKIGEYAVYMKKIEGGTAVRMPTINVLVKIQVAIRKLGEQS